MDEKSIKELLQKVQDGNSSVDEAFSSLKDLPYEDIGLAQIDHHRTLRKGFPEVILGSGKTADQIIAIVERLEAKQANILVTRVDDAKAEAVTNRMPRLNYDPTSRTLIRINKDIPKTGYGTILVVTAGTSDISVAEEAVITCELLGNRVKKLYDVGVAGIHRLFGHIQMLEKASVVIVVAGMEGALASVVAGLTDRPVIAVPTSVGYGASFGGLAALLGMLNSCSCGVSVVNIDNGFGAAFTASQINRIPNHRK